MKAPEFSRQSEISRGSFARPSGRPTRIESAMNLNPVHDLLFEFDDTRNLQDDAMTRSRIESLVMLFQSAFLDEPMLSLTLPAAQRRFGVDEVTCAGVLDALVDAGVLTERESVYRRNYPGRAVQHAA